MIFTQDELATNLRRLTATYPTRAEAEEMLRRIVTVSRQRRLDTATVVARLVACKDFHDYRKGID